MDSPAPAHSPSAPYAAYALFSHHAPASGATPPANSPVASAPSPCAAWIARFIPVAPATITIAPAPSTEPAAIALLAREGLVVRHELDAERGHTILVIAVVPLLVAD